MNRRIILILLFLVVFLSACSPSNNTIEEQNAGEPEPPVEVVIPTSTAEPSPEPTPVPTETLPSYQILQGLTYRGGSTGKIDFFQPAAGNDQGLTILMFHPGRGRPSDLYKAGLFFVEQGYQVAVVGFRDWPKYQYPVPVGDVFCAVAWMAANQEEYGFHIDKLVTYGHSFGGTLAAELVVVEQPEIFLTECSEQWSDAIRFVGAAAFTGIYDYEEVVSLSPGLADYANNYLTGSLEEVPELWRQASPAEWVDGSEPPILLIHGVRDNIPVANAEYFAQILDKAGVLVTTVWSEDLVHEDLVPSEKYMAVVEEFLKGLLFED